MKKAYLFSFLMIGVLVVSLFSALAYGQLPPTTGSGYNSDPEYPPITGPGFNPPSQDPCAFGGCQNDEPDTVPPSPADAAPTASVSVPATAAPGSSITVSATGFDNVDVAELQFFDAASVLLQAVACPGVQTSCTASITQTAPSAFSTTYTYKARAKDSAGQLSAFVSASGTTTAASTPSPTPSLAAAPAALVKAPVVSGVRVISPVSVLQPLFFRSVSFDSECVRPGESALLAVKVQNKGKQTLKDVKFSASVPELGISASSGPSKLTTNDKSIKYLMIDVPADVQEGEYMLKFTASNSKFRRSTYSPFMIDGAC